MARGVSRKRTRGVYRRAWRPPRTLRGKFIGTVTGVVAATRRRFAQVV